MKQESCLRVGSKQVRRHSKKSYTPAQRLLDSGKLSEKHRNQLKEQLSGLNPFELKAEIKNKEDEFWRDRAILIAQEEERLASKGSSTLRSEQPLEAQNQPQTQKA